MPQKSNISDWLGKISSQSEIRLKTPYFRSSMHRRRVLKAKNDYFMKLVHEEVSKWKVIEI